MLPGSEGRSNPGDARTAEPIFAATPALVALPAGVQPLRRNRSPGQSLPGLLPRARTVAPALRVSPMRNPDRRRVCGGPRAGRGRVRRLSGLPRQSSSVRPGSRTVELRPASQQSRSPDEVLPGSGGGGSPRTTSRARAGGADPAPGARCGSRAAALQAPPPQAGIQPRRGVGGHCPARPRPATATVRTHRPPPLSSPGEGTKRGGTLRERRGCVHDSPVALPDETSGDCRRRADHGRHRIRAGAGAARARCGMDRGLVLCPSHPRLSGGPWTILAGTSAAATAREDANRRKRLRGSNRTIISVSTNI